MDEMETAIQEYIVKKFLKGRGESRFSPTTPLITGGILDSLATLELVGFLEKQYGIKVEAHEASVDYLNTVNEIAKFVRSKQASTKR
jgi:acyl carrier protein